MQALIDQQLDNLGYTTIGLQDNNLIKTKLKKGSNAALFFSVGRGLISNPKPYLENHDVWH
jgi:hypothetical protein